MQRLSHRIFALLLIAAVGLAGCDSAGVDGSSESEAPNVLTPEAFNVDVLEAPSGKQSVGPHFTAALLRYVPVSVTLGIKYLLIPKVVTEMATQEDPVLEDGAWVWTRSSESGVGITSLVLTGRPVGNAVEFEMSVSGTNAYTGEVEDFRLYTARTNADGTSGTWDLYYKVDGEAVNVLDAEFEIVDSTDKHITFTVPNTAPDFPGYGVRYERSGDERIFHWSQPDEGEEHVLTWNPEAGIGSIESTNYKDGKRYCWDASGADVACPAS